MNTDLDPQVIAGDVISLSIVVGTLVQYLPAVAAVVSIVWGCIRIYETKTVQNLLGRKPTD